MSDSKWQETQQTKLSLVIEDQSMDRNNGQLIKFL